MGTKQDDTQLSFKFNVSNRPELIKAPQLGEIEKSTYREKNFNDDNEDIFDHHPTSHPHSFKLRWVYMKAFPVASAPDALCSNPLHQCHHHLYSRIYSEAYFNSEGNNFMNLS